MILSRRSTLLGLAASLLPLPLSATPAEVADSIARLFGDRPLTEGRMTLDLPALAETGNSVPLTVRVESPMTAGDRILRLALFAALFGFAARRARAVFLRACLCRCDRPGLFGLGIAAAGARAFEKVVKLLGHFRVAPRRLGQAALSDLPIAQPVGDETDQICHAHDNKNRQANPINVGKDRRNVHL